MSEQREGENPQSQRDIRQQPAVANELVHHLALSGRSSGRQAHCRFCLEEQRGEPECDCSRAIAPRAREQWRRCSSSSKLVVGAGDDPRGRRRRR